MPAENRPEDHSDVVIVPAGPLAYPEYKKHHWYVCQGGRSFRREITHMGFYANGAIQIHVPWIQYREDDVVFTHEEAARRRNGTDRDRVISQIIEISLNTGVRDDGMRLQVFLLSPSEGDNTVRLARPIRNDAVSSSGRRIAWARNLRYASLDKLTTPDVTATSQLDRR